MTEKPKSTANLPVGTRNRLNSNYWTPAVEAVPRENDSSKKIRVGKVTLSK